MATGGDPAEAEHCRELVSAAGDAFGKIDTPVSNAAYQMGRATLEEISDGEWEYTFRTNVSDMFPSPRWHSPEPLAVTGGRPIL